MNIKISVLFIALSATLTAQKTYYSDCGKHFNVKTGLLSYYGESGPLISLHSESRFTDHFWGNMGIGYSTRINTNEQNPQIHRGYFSYTLFYAPIYSEAWRLSYGAGVSTLLNLTESSPTEEVEGLRFRNPGGIIPQIQQTVDMTYHWAIRWALQFSTTLFIDRRKETSYAVEGGVSYSF